jgi:hypothetical protein
MRNQVTHRGARCIIHIGMHKTGSTSIQRSFDGFDDKAFFYARLGERGNHSLSIYSIFANRPERHHLHRSAGHDQAGVERYNKKVWDRLNRSIAAARHRTFIISGEDITALPETDLEKLRDYFDTRFDDVTVVGYVRPPAGFITSSFQQRVKSGALSAFDPFRMYRNYEKSFGKFDRVFGSERVELWKFDPNAFPQGDVVADFCSRMGIALPKRRFVRVNESLSRQAVAALYIYNKFGKHPGARALVDRLGALFKGGKLRLSPDIVRPVLERNRADIAWMEARLGRSLEEDLSGDREGDIRSEMDLIRPDPEIAAVLRGKLGRLVPPDIKGATAEDIAALIDALHRRRYLGLGRWLPKLGARDQAQAVRAPARLHPRKQPK